MLVGIGSSFVVKLQADVRRLQDGLQEKRLDRLESSEYILQEARSQLEVLQQAVCFQLSLYVPVPDKLSFSSVTQTSQIKQNLPKFLNLL